MATGTAISTTTPVVAAARGNPVLEMFLFCQLIGLVRYSIIAWVGDWFVPVAGAVQYGSVMLLPILLHGYSVSRQPGDGLIRPARAWVTLVSIVVLVQTAAGFGWGYDTREIVQDSVGFFTLLAFVSLGATAKFWDDIWIPAMRMLLLAFAVNLVGMMEMGSVLSSLSGDLTDRVARDLVAYRSQHALALWPIVLLTCRERSRRARLFIIVVVGFGFVQQVLFQKRLGTLDFLVYGSLFLFWMPRSVGSTVQQRLRAHLEERRLRQMCLSFAVAGCLLVAITMPAMFMAQASSLADRFLGSHPKMNKSEEGWLTAVMFENERFEIARYLFEDFDAQEWVIGRGMGGYFNVPFVMTGNETRDNALAESLYLSDVNAIGRRSLEVGALFPFIKGGVILMVVVYAGMLAAILRWRRCLTDPLSTACLYVSSYEVLYLLQGGGFQMNSCFRLLMYGACLGRCLSKGMGWRRGIGRTIREGMR